MSLSALVSCQARSVLLVIVCVVGVSGCANLLPTRGNTHGPDSNYATVNTHELVHRARQAYTQNRFYDAANLYQQLVVIVPNDAEAWFRLGNAYTQQGSIQQAVQAYERSLSIQPDQPKAWFNLSTAFLLNAQATVRESQARMQVGDPAIAVADARLQQIDRLLAGRFE